MTVSADLNPGIYMVSAYGGKELKWTKTSKLSPFYIRMNIPDMSASGRMTFTSGPFGINRWFINGKPNFYRLELPERDTALLKVGYVFNDTNPYTASDYIETISSNNRESVAELYLNDTHTKKYIVTVETEPGKKFVLHHFRIQKYHELKSKNINYYLETIHSGYGEDTVDATALLLEKRYGKKEILYEKDSNIYDLGCSNGNFGVELLNQMGKIPFHMIAVDNSIEMIDTYNKRLNQKPLGCNISTICECIEHIDIQNASVVVINLTLQFLPVSLRDSIIDKIYKGLNKNGILLLSEKIKHKEASLANLQQNLYYSFKKENGYSNMEISQKRDALDNVLIPETVEEHIRRFKKSGFKHYDIWLKWFNFSSFICQK